MTLQQAIQNDSYIVCANIEERDMIIAMLKNNGLQRIGPVWPNELSVAVYQTQGYLTIIHGANPDMNIYHASQFLTQGEPPLTC